MRPRRVLLLTSNYPRWDGDSTTPFVANLAHDLTAQGWGVDVVAPHAVGAKRREVVGGVRIRRFRYLLPASQQTVAYGGGALINLRQNRANWFKLPFLVLAELITTIWLLATRRYAVVNAHWLLPQGFVGAVAGLITRTPLVTTVHGGDVFDLKGGVLTRLKAWAVRRSAATTVNSSATRTAVEAISAEARSTTIPMGIDIPDEPASDDQVRLAAQAWPEPGTRLIFVGRLVFEKGVDDLIRAVGILAEREVPATLLVVGTGQDEEALQDLAAEVAVESRVAFHGWADPSDVPALMAAADIFVGPSKQSETGWQEGLGLVFLEAMATETPVIATASGGIPDIVRHGETGILISENAPAEIADAVQHLLAAPEQAASLARAGGRLARESYSRESSARRFAALFDRVRIGSPNPAEPG